MRLAALLLLVLGCQSAVATVPPGDISGAPAASASTKGGRARGGAAVGEIGSGSGDGGLDGDASDGPAD
jgi:hypothetical protein